MYTNVTKHTEMKYKLHIYMQARARAVVWSPRLVVVVVLLFPDKGDVGICVSGGGGICHRQSGVGIIGGGVGRQGKRE